MVGPIPYPESPHPGQLPPQQQFPQQGPPGYYYPGQVPSPYPGAMPPPVSYPSAPRRKRLAVVIGVLVVVAVVIAGVTAAILRSDGGDDTVATVNQATATSAIQGYLDALAKGDDDTVARNGSCGFYDAVKDRRADMTLAKLTSDAFRAQFGSARVSSIDKIVTWSPLQAQVLFTMRATPAGRGQGEVERQGVAQLLVDGKDILVCSYLPRNSGQF